MLMLCTHPWDSRREAYEGTSKHAMHASHPLPSACHCSIHLFLWFFWSSHLLQPIHHHQGIHPPPLHHHPSSSPALRKLPVQMDLDLKHSTSSRDPVSSEPTPQPTTPSPASHPSSSPTSPPPVSPESRPFPHPYRSHQQNHHHPYARPPPTSWHSAPGADLALLSEMKASKADLTRFRRESQWLEERVTRPKYQDKATQRILNKALDLTRTANRQQLLPRPPPSISTSTPFANYTQPPRLPQQGPNVTVQLSSDSRVALSSLKANLFNESEEQARLESDQRTLEHSMERIQAKIVEKENARVETQSRTQILLERQSELESELRRIQKMENACQELQEQQRTRFAEEVTRLEATVRLLKEKNGVRDTFMALRV